MDTFNHGSQQQQHQQAQQQHQQKSGHAAATPSYAAHPEASVGGQQTPNEKRHGHQYGGMNPATAHYDPYSVPIMSPAYQQNGSNNTPVRYPGHAATFYPGAPLAQFPIPAGAQIYHTAAGQVLVYPEGLQGMPFYTHMNTTPPQTPANTASFFQPGQEFHYYTPPGHGPLMAPGLTPSSGLGSAERRRSSGISDGSSPRTPEFQYHEAQQTPVRQNHPHKLRFNSPSLVGLERLGAAGKFRKPSGTPYQHSIHSIQEHLAFEGFMNHHEDGVNTNVYIRGLSAEMDDDKLFEMTACYGNVISHKAIMDTENGGCKGYVFLDYFCFFLLEFWLTDIFRYGFARFETVEEAVLCIEKLTEMNIEADFARVSSFRLFASVFDSLLLLVLLVLTSSLRNHSTADLSVSLTLLQPMFMFPTCRSR